LQDACQDGVRKKAKYLHDAPNEALMPGAGTNLLNSAATVRTNSSTQNNEAGSQQNQFFRPPQGYPVFPPAGPMPPPILPDLNMSTPIFGQQSPIQQSYSVAGHQTLATPTIAQVPDSAPRIGQSWNGALFDPSDPALFNFDLASMNFGNHYGALEFGMLGHLATGAGVASPSDTTTQRGSLGQHNGASQYPIPLNNFSDSPGGQSGFPYNEVITGGDWQKSQDMYNQQFPSNSDPPNAFAIESNVAQFTPPDTESTPPDALKFEDSPLLSSSTSRPAVTSTPANQQNRGAPFVQESSQRPPAYISTPQLKSKSQIPVKSTKRPRDPSSIYTAVTSPYPYTAGFHSLIAYLQRRFAMSPSKTLTIAKSLASIRPSFIATTKTLNRDDLIFMEKCFQRTLWEYEGFIEGVGTPTIVARRTGEIAAVGKEFEILTGWTKKVLLGRAPNLNVNRGGSPGSSSAGQGSGVNTTGRATGVSTPIYRSAPSQEPENGEKRLQPVFLAELLDDDSVVAFYEDFARLAFGDSRGSVMGKGKVLKYRTKDYETEQNFQREQDRSDGPTAVDHSQWRRGDEPRRQESSSISARQQGELKREGISGERGMQRLGAVDGKVECTFCWTVKRDVFDIPMLIVMNVSFLVA
jgi:hypothetical protein